MKLVVSNLFGQNAAAIAAVEGQYEQMWAADVSAMAGYHSAVSGLAAQLVPWRGSLPAALRGAASAATLSTITVSIGNAGSFNLGLGNIGSFNIGSGNHGDANLGSGNKGDLNLGNGNIGDNNFRRRKSRQPQLRRRKYR